MYSEASIALLKGRIGFGKLLGIPNTVTIEEQHRSGSSGQLFSFFHKLVTLKNLYATVDDINMNSADFNEYLDQLKSDAVNASIKSILTNHEEYDLEKDYSELIISRPELFDFAIGYTMAITCIEQMISTSRLSNEERNANFAYTKLKVDIEGARDDNGRTVAKGLNGHLGSAIYKAVKVIYPKKRMIDSIQYW